jgi:alpha-galactosidase
MSVKRLAVLLGLALVSLSAFASDLIGINGPTRIGVVTDRPFLYLIPATGKSLSYSAQGLPSGLSVDESTGIIKGSASKNGEYTVRLTVSNRTQSQSKDVSFVVGPKALALTPIMGWNPWYVWGCFIDDAKIRQAADLLVSSGLAAHGYNYINLDDCWQDKRDANGDMLPNARFPDMKALADYVHSKGLRIGMYTSPGNTTCGGYEGTKDHNFERGVSYLEKDVEMYARWGFDFIKYDWCIFPSDAPTRDHYYSKQQTLYQRMTDAIEKSSRAMVHMICQYGERNVHEWAPSVGGNMWRTNHDLADTWPAVLRNGFANLKLSQYASPGHWNDLDMLMVGKANWPKKLGDYDIPGTTPRPTQLTKDEQITHMTLWSMMASPLLFSSDLTQLDEFTLSLLTNDDMIAVNQDALGAPIKEIFTGDKIVITRPLADGTMAVAMFNLNKTTQRLAVDTKMMGLNSSFTTKNVWTGEVLSNQSKVEAVIPAHGAYFVKVFLP